MTKALIGPRLRTLRREHGHSQAEMARRLGVSPAYVNLLESNQRSLSVKMLLVLGDRYGVDLRDLLTDPADTLLNDLRQAVRDPVIGVEEPDLQELRAAIDHAPRLVTALLSLHGRYHALADRIQRRARSLGPGPDGDVRSDEAMVHDVFRVHGNHFPDLETAADAIRSALGACEHGAAPALAERLALDHGIAVTVAPIEAMGATLRHYDAPARRLALSEALDAPNRAFQLAHVLALVEARGAIAAIASASGLDGRRHDRLKVELANYVAAAILMPYEPMREAAEALRYDIDRLAMRFGASFEQVCQRLTTLRRDGAAGLPFFFLRVDRAGNVTKRFNATQFRLAEYGGACPRWRLHDAFRVPGSVLTQTVEMPEGERFFTLCRTVSRPGQHGSVDAGPMAVALGCPASDAPRLGYADAEPRPGLDHATPIGINCQLCPRQGCAERAHPPLHSDLPIDTARRGITRHES